MAYNSGAAAAAAARQRMLEEEEEEQMTPYSSDELQNDWEFKIVRAGYGAFSNPAKLNKLIDQEKQAGWVLLEKLDDSRVRFKRPRSAGANDAQLVANGIDPYRTQYGLPRQAFALVIAVFFMVLVLAIGLFAMLSISHP